MVTAGRVGAVDGSTIKITVKSICVHGDSPGAVDIAIYRNRDDLLVEVIGMAVRDRRLVSTLQFDPVVVTLLAEHEPFDARGRSRTHRHPRCGGRADGRAPAHRAEGSRGPASLRAGETRREGCGAHQGRLAEAARHRHLRGGRQVRQDE